ncbi:YjbQ family protein [Candidatus Micrarchaeota archaeon]|nr:YjbQ family protein [Candidatus Micrarchaeota archaeon]
MKSFSVQTQKKLDVLDITDSVEKQVTTDAKLLHVFCPHTTCAVVVNEFESRLAEDFVSLAKEWYGKKWKHDASDGNAAAHLLSSQLGSGATLIVQNGKIQLGTWQRILLLELDGPRQRDVWVQEIR